MTQEQLLQEARKEAEKVYPNVEINLSDSVDLTRGNIIRRRDNSLLMEGYIACYMQQAEKRKSDIVKLLEWLTREESEISVLYGGIPELENDYRFCDNKKEYTAEELYDLFLQQLKQE